MSSLLWTLVLANCLRSCLSTKDVGGKVAKLLPAATQRLKSFAGLDFRKILRSFQSLVKLQPFAHIQPKDAVGIDMTPN